MLDQFHAAIARPALLGRVVSDRLGVPKPRGGQARGSDAILYQPGDNCGGTLLREGLINGFGARRIGMAFDFRFPVGLAV